MPAPEQVTLRSPDGTPVLVPVDQAGTLIASGYRVETGVQAADRAAMAAREDVYGGVGGTIEAGLAGAARGATLGLSDAALSALGGGEDLQALREVHPYASAAGEIGGGLASAFAAPESLLARTPGGAIAGLGAKIAGFGEEAGVLGRVGATAAGAAFEGAAQGAGSYISDVALGDRELSADGFMGAMGKGALWGGVAGGSLAIASEGLTAARRLFPRSEVTREAVAAAEQTAKQELSSAASDSEQLAQAARDRLRQIRADMAAQDLATKTRLDEIAVRKAEEMSAAGVRAAEAKAQAAEARLERIKNPARKVRKAVQDTETAAAGEAVAIPEAAAAGVAEDTTTALERQLQATKQGIDAGKTLADLNTERATFKATHIEDALNAEIAKVNPEAQQLVSGLEKLEQSQGALDSWLDKYKGGSVSKFERNQSARDYAEGMRKKSGYASVVPEGEGTAGLPRGRMYEWRGGSEAERAAIDARTLAKVAPEDQIAADAAIEEAAARRSASRRSKDIATEVTAPEAAPIETRVDAALKSKVDSIDDDIHESAKVIGQHEAAAADLTEALGPVSPPSSQARAQAFREAQQKAERSTQEATKRATMDAEKVADAVRLHPEVQQPKTPHGRAASVLGAAQDAGAALEALRMVGIDVPDPKNIPVIGPLLSAYLKARVLGKAFGRFGGKVAQTAETTIAGKAAQTQQRVFEALDRMTEVAVKVTSKAAPRVGSPAAALAHTLFDDGEPKAKPYSTEVAPSGSIADVFLARADEVNRALEPGAIEKAVRARVHTSDPAVVDAIAEAQRRKLKFLSAKMPRPMESPVPTQAHMPWVPSKAEINQWSRYVQAAEDPVAVIEAAAKDGHVSAEAVETLQTVYPKLFAAAQQRIIERALDATKPLPYARRVQLSVMFDMPMDGSQTPEGAAFLQQSYKAPPPMQPPQMPATQPTVTADVRMADRVDPST